MAKNAQLIIGMANQLEIEETKFANGEGNMSAGKRARKILMDIKKLCGTARTEIQDAKKTEKAA